MKDVKILIDDPEPRAPRVGQLFWPPGIQPGSFRQLDTYVVRRLNMFRWKRFLRQAKPSQQICWEREKSEATRLLIARNNSLPQAVHPAL